MSKEMITATAAARFKWWRFIALTQLIVAGATFAVAVPGWTAWWAGLFPLVLAGLFRVLQEIAGREAVDPSATREPKSSIVDDATWQDLAYGPGSAHHRTQQAIDRIQDELDAPERQLREARSWANHIMGLGADTALRILATQVAIDRAREAEARRAEQERAEQRELAEFIEWMGDDGVGVGGRGPVDFSRLAELDRERERELAVWHHAKRRYDERIRQTFAVGGYVQDVDETLVYNGLGEVIHPYADGVVYCTDGRRIFSERFVRDYDPMRITHYKCGDHFHKNDGT